MRRVGRLEVWVALMVAANLGVGWAASPVIGVAVARGMFHVDSSQVAGNSNLFDGTTIETGRATSELQLHGGVRMYLAAGTRGRVYRDRLLLERGASQVEAAKAYRIQAGGLEVSGEGPSAAKVTFRGADKVQVAALRGPVRVRTTTGIVIASLAPGNTLELNSQNGGASAPSTVTGCLMKKDGRYFVTDETAQVKVELKGAGLEREAGNRVEVTGVHDPTATLPEGVSLVLRVNQVKRAGKGCPSGAVAAAGAGAAGTAGAAGAGTTAGAATAAGASVAAKAIIAGVVVAAAATGTAVGITREEDPKPSISQ